MSEIIEIKQLPILEERLKSLKTEIEEKTQTALSMVCTEDTVKEIKKMRASLTKEFTELEVRRKDVKAQIEAPYQEFYKVYQECVSVPFKNADAELKKKIDKVEDTLKADKHKKITAYANELKTAYAVDWLNVERVLPNITLSASLTSLKQAVADRFEAVRYDCQCISELAENSAEILAEYKKSLNLSQAQLTVLQRKKDIEQAKTDVLTATEQEQMKQKTEQKVEMLAPPVVEDKAKEKEYKMSFTVHGTISQLKELKDFMLERGIRYE